MKDAGLVETGRTLRRYAIQIQVVQIAKGKCVSALFDLNTVVNTPPHKAGTLERLPPRVRTMKIAWSPGFKRSRRLLKAQFAKNTAAHIRMVQIAKPQFNEGV
jgi:hypothetical protein